MPSLEGVNALAAERDYKNRDEVTISPTAMPGDLYQTKLAQFFDEHLHEDEEIRYIRDGAGYFDVRSEGDEWIRIKLVKDDLIILPAGIYHRFTTDDSDVCFTCFPIFCCWESLLCVRLIGKLTLVKTVYPGYASVQGGAQVDAS